MSFSPIGNITYLVANQANAAVTVNEAFNVLEALAHLIITDRNLTAPPGSPSNGDAYIVGASATGAWSGEDGNIAIYYDGWVDNENGDFMPPTEGMRIYVKDEDTLMVYDGTNWVGVPICPAIPSSMQQALRSANPGGLAATMTSTYAYFAYMGKMTQNITPTKVRLGVTAAASGVSATEVGLFSTSNTPDGSDQTLTKIVAGDSTGMTTVGTKENTTPFATVVPTGTHLWAGFYMAATGMPNILGLCGDLGVGDLLVDTSTGSLTANSSFSGVRPTASANPWTVVVPDMRVVW